MTVREAKNILKEYEWDFDIEDTMFGDGSRTIQYKYLMDSETEAKEFVEALKVVLNSINKK